MATTLDYIDFVCDQINGCGEIYYKKMFGEYMVYVNDKPILLVCDNTVFVKKLAEISELMIDADCGFPYEGAKEHYILNIDNSSFCKDVIAILETLVQIPKPRKKKNKS